MFSATNPSELTLADTALVTDSLGRSGGWGPAHSPDLDGRAVQDLPVTVPGAPRGRAAANGAVVAHLPKRLLPVFLQVTVLIFHVLRRELEFLDSVNLNEGEVELPRQTSWRPVSETNLPALRLQPAGTRGLVKTHRVVSPSHQPSSCDSLQTASVPPAQGLQTTAD